MRGNKLIQSVVGAEIKHQASLRPHKVALIHGGRQMTYAELEANSRALAKGFLKLGFRRGDRVCLWLTNSLEWVVSQAALARLGIIAVLANTRYRTMEMEYILKHSGSRAVIFADRFLNNDYVHMVHQLLPEMASGVQPTSVASLALPDLRYLICQAEQEYAGMFRWKDLAELGRSVSDDELEAAEADVTPADVLYIIYTSGTTGKPKGSMTAHGPALKNSFNSGERQAFGEDDRLLMFLPFFHCFGGVNGILNPLTHGATLVIQDQFDPVETLRMIGRYGVTTVYGVPTNFLMMLTAFRQDPTGYNLSSWTKGCVGGGELFAHLGQAIERELQVPYLTQAYGMTECSAIICQSAWNQPFAERLSTCGNAMPDVETLIVRQDTLEPCEDGEVGEILIGGFGVHRGYYNLPVGSDDGLVDGKWFRAGDLGVREANGNLKLLGRVRDMYKASGFNVYPLEVENLLVTHPMVAEAAVVAAPDPVKLEVGVAYLRLKPGAACTEEEILSFCRGQIANFKVPARVIFVEDYPRTHATQKIQKAALRDRAVADYKPTATMG